MPIARIAAFLAVVLSITFLIHRYLWARLVRDAAWPAPWRSAATWGLVLLGLSIPAAFTIGALFPRAVARPLAWLAYVWMGLMFYLLVLLLPFELPRLFMGSGRIDLARRRSLSRLLAAGVSGAAAVVGGLGTVSALSRVAVKRVPVRIKGLPEALRGFRIVQLTDIHVGPTIGHGLIEELVATSNALLPDVVAITGDLVDGTVAELAEHVAPLSKLVARDGVLFVTGNHEYYSRAAEWVAHLPSIGLRVLRNERVSVERGGAHLDLAGIDDWTAHQFADGHGADLGKALAGRDRSRPVVLLAHQPKAVHEAARLGVHLVLAGHTHGGQIFPFNLAVKLSQPFNAGLDRVGETQIYVSRGSGYWGPPMRVLAPAEVTLVELLPA